MTIQRLNPQKILIGTLKLVLGVALALMVLGLAGVATARYFLTQLASLPERPVYSNDKSEQTQAAAPESPTSGEAESAPNPPAAAEAPAPEETAEQPTLYQVTVTYGVGLVLRSGPGTDYSSVGGVDYNATLDVVAEKDGWLNVKANGQEGWIKGQGNTQRL